MTGDGVDYVLAFVALALVLYVVPMLIVLGAVLHLRRWRARR